MVAGVRAGQAHGYIGYETEASRVQVFTLGYVPGLLQTADYARALMVAVPVRRNEEQLDNEVAARLYRQQRLRSVENPLELVAVIDESVLHRPVGGPEVLRGQLRHLAALGDLDSVTLHVLPTAVGAHAALASEFNILHFGDLDEPDMAYVEHTLGALNLDKEEDVARARLTFERLLSDALDPAESLALVRRLAGGEPVRRRRPCATRSSAGSRAASAAATARTASRWRSCPAR